MTLMINTNPGLTIKTKEARMIKFVSIQRSHSVKVMIRVIVND